MGTFTLKIDLEDNNTALKRTSDRSIGMYIIACVDDRNGLLFNNRRQSRDAKVIDKILELTKKSRLWIHPFSSVLFPEARISENFLEEAKTGEFCFLENMQPKETEQIEGIYLFRWNRTYPYDTVLAIPMESFRKIHEESFAGSSHDKITLEVYRR